jgi:hypothetical protein
MGLFSTLLNTYVARKGQWSTFAAVAAIVMLCCLVLAGVMSILCWARILQLEWEPGWLNQLKRRTAEVFRPQKAKAANYRQGQNRRR